MFTSLLSAFLITNTDSTYNWLYCHLSHSSISEPSVCLCASLCKMTAGIIFRCCLCASTGVLGLLSFHALCFYIYQSVPGPLTCCFYCCLLLCAFYFIIKGKNKSLFSTPFIPSFGSSTFAIPFWRCGFPLQSCDLKRPCKVKPRLKKCAGCLAGILSAKSYQVWEFHLSCTTWDSDLFTTVTCDVLYIPSTRCHDLFIMFGDIFTFSFSGTVMSSSINIPLLSKLSWSKLFVQWRQILVTADCTTYGCLSRTI